MGDILKHKVLKSLRQEPDIVFVCTRLLLAFIILGINYDQLLLDEQMALLSSIPPGDRKQLRFL